MDPIESKKNPISVDKITETPHLLPYAHHVGSAIIKPLDKGKVKGVAMKAMYQQTDSQLLQIKEQVETLIRQAQNIHDRIALSEKIYQADCGFKPIIGNTYFLYAKTDESWLISMIAPEEWGKSKPYTYLATIELKADSTWGILDKSGEI
ncbi:MAG TPA: DUF2452 domain-containing protein [Saprospiraceae bacterium]|nr:DUF2452 domain-containing protein [Saprospiraceae bacterium]